MALQSHSGLALEKGRSSSVGARPASHQWSSDRVLRHFVRTWWLGLHRLRSRKQEAARVCKELMSHHVEAVKEFRVMRQRLRRRSVGTGFVDCKRYIPYVGIANAMQARL